MIFSGNLSRSNSGNSIADELANACTFYASFDQWIGNECTPEVGLGKLNREIHNSANGLINDGVDVDQNGARRIYGNNQIATSSDFKFYDSNGDLPFTDCVWFKMDDTTGSQGIYFNSNFNSIQAPSLFYTTDKIYCQLRSKKGGSLAYIALECNVSLAVGQWYLLTRTYNGDELNPLQKCYINGVELSGSITTIGVAYTGMDNVYNAINIGAGQSKNVPFRGLIDEFSVYKNYEMSLEAHQYLYNNGQGRQYPFN